MNASDVTALLVSKSFKQVQYKVAADTRKPSWYLNFKRHGKLTTRLLIFIGETEVSICWESKKWPMTYRSTGTKLDYDGMTEANHFPIMTIKHRREMSLAIVPTGGMRDIHGPAIVTLQGSALQGLRTREWGVGWLMHEPWLDA